MRRRWVIWAGVQQAGDLASKTGQKQKEKARCKATVPPRLQGLVAQRWSVHGVTSGANNPERIYSLQLSLQHRRQLRPTTLLQGSPQRLCSMRCRRFVLSSSPSALGGEERQPCSRNPRTEPAVDSFILLLTDSRGAAKLRASIRGRRRGRNMPALNPAAALTLERVPWCVSCMCLPWGICSASLTQVCLNHRERSCHW